MVSVCCSCCVSFMLFVFMLFVSVGVVHVVCFGATCLCAHVVVAVLLWMSVCVFLVVRVRVSGCVCARCCGCLGA